MQGLLAFSNAVDRFNTWINRYVIWLILAATLISAVNALVRKIFNTSSNAFLEVQWYLFAAVFMLGAGYGLLKNSHVRIDFISSRFSARTRNWVDIGGILVFLVPLCWLMIAEGWPLFERAWTSGEMSGNAGGLIRWPAYLLIPAGFAILLLQGASELIKRAAFLLGQGPDVLASSGPSDEERRAQELLDEQKRLQGAQ